MTDKGKKVEQTDRDPLGAGIAPGNFTQDPTDNRAIGRQSAENVTSPKGSREIEHVKNKNVTLTAPHYINDEMYEAGAVLEDYSGPLSANMIVEGEDQPRERASGPSFRRR